MVKLIRDKPAKRDDPIYREGLTISTPRSHRGSTPSTKPSPKTPATSSENAESSLEPLLTPHQALALAMKLKLDRFK
jgi:hypothetical protein